jgi:hypothetical protein
MSNEKPQARRVLALICAIWFVLTGWMWLYAANILFSYPFAILGFFLWKNAEKAEPHTRLNRVTIWMLGIGLFLSIGSLFLYK